MSELKPCPFCGGEADVMLSQSRWGQSHTIHHDALGKCPAEYVGSMQFATEAEAIAAWNARAGRGTLTAEQVLEATYAHSIHADCADADWQAIADELNATLGGGECSIEERNGDWYCVGCGEMVGTCDTASELYIDGNAVELWSYCPRCGKAVKR